MYKERNPKFIFYKYVDYEKMGVEEHFFEFIFQGKFYSHAFYVIITEADDEVRYETTFNYTQFMEVDVKHIENVYFTSSYYSKYDPHKTLCENIQMIMDTDCKAVNVVPAEEVKKHIKLYQMPTPERR